MKWIKRFNESTNGVFNEELLPSTYLSAATKLKNLGHKRRAGELEAWKKEVEEKEKQLRISQRIESMKKFGTFRLKFMKSKWNSKTSSSNYEPFFEGNFFIEPSFPYDWFLDMMSDSETDGHSLSLPIEFGVSPSDGETAVGWEKCKLAGETWEGMYFPCRVWIQLTNEAGNWAEKPRCSFESVDNDIFFFSTRGEAIRFKKLLVEAILGQNDWGKNKWYSEGLISAFRACFNIDRESRGRERERGKDVRDQYFTEEDLPRLAMAVKIGLSLNDLYLD